VKSNDRTAIARDGDTDAVRAAAADKVIDRAMGKAPQHIDTSAVRHTEIVYRSAEEIRQELLARGVPQVLLDYTPPAPEPSADSDVQDPQACRYSALR
jgi:hypothetical protein